MIWWFLILGVSTLWWCALQSLYICVCGGIYKQLTQRGTEEPAK